MAVRALLITVALIGVAGSAQAQSLTATTGMPVTGNVPQICAMQRGQIQPGTALNVVGLDGDTLRIAEFVDPATLSVKAASATVKFEAVCNFAHAVHIESTNNGLWTNDSRVTQQPVGFAFAVPYSARITWGSVNNQFHADAKARRLAQQTFNVDSAVAGEMVLNLQIDEGASNVEVDAPVVAGTYTDTIRIVLEPR